MSNQSLHAQQSLAGQVAPGFRQKNALQKLVQLLKVAAFLATFGFAFPTILEDF